MQKNVLCYGDSNTWGYNAQSDDDPGRFSRLERWTGVCQQQLGDDYYVIEEGLNGRTTVWDDPIEDYRNGKTFLMPCLLTHMPLDLVVIMLGSNDLKRRFNHSPFTIASGAGKLAEIVLTSTTGHNNSAPQVLLLAPPPIGKLIPRLDGMFEGAAEKAPLLAEQYRRVAEELGCHFLDTAQFLTPDPADGLHLTVNGQRTLGEKVAEKIQSIFA